MWNNTLLMSVLLASSAMVRAAEEESVSKDRLLTYQCDQGAQLQVSYAADASQATVALPDGKSLVLPAKPVASGFAYATAQHSLRGKGVEVTFTVGRRAPMQCRVADSTSNVAKATWALQNTYWRLRQINGQSVVLAKNQREPHLVLGSKDNRMHGFAGCNRMMGGYESAAETLHFKGVAVTMMACPEGMDTELAFTRALEQTQRYHIDDATLNLLDAEGKLLAQLEATALK